MNKKRLDLLTVIAIMMILLSVGGYIWLNGKLLENHGPVHLRTNQQSVVVSDSHSLHQLDSQGKLVRSVALQQLGLPSALMDMQILDDGSLLIAEAQQQTIQHCDADLAVGSCKTFADVSGLTWDFFKFFFDENTARLYLAVTHKNKIYALDEPYTEQTATLLYDKVSAPNEIVLQNSDTLWVTDTDNHQVITLDVSSTPAQLHDEKLNGVTASEHIQVPDNGFSFSHLLSAGTEFGHQFPLNIAINELNNKKWVVLSGSTYLDGVLVEYDENNAFSRQIMLSAKADPIVVEAFGQDALVTDMANFAIHHVTDDGLQLFGDQAFKEKMMIAKSDYDQLVLYKQLAFWGIIISGLLVGVVLIFAAMLKQLPSQLLEKPVEDDGRDDPLAHKGVIWLEPDSKYIKNMKLGFLFIGLLMVTLVGMMPIMASISDNNAAWEVLLALSVIVVPLLAMMALLAIMLFYQFRHAYPKIGAGFGKLFLEDQSEQVHVFQPQDIYHSRNTFLVKSYSVSLADNRHRSMYDSVIFQRHFQPILENASYLKPERMFLQKLKQKDTIAWMLVINIAYILVISVIFKFPEFVAFFLGS